MSQLSQGLFFGKVEVILCHVTRALYTVFLRMKKVSLTGGTVGRDIKYFKMSTCKSLMKIKRKIVQKQNLSRDKKVSVQQHNLFVIF